MQITITGKQDLGNGLTALTVRVRRNYGMGNNADFGDEIVLIVPSSHEFCQDVEYHKDTGQRHANGNPIYVLDKRPKTEAELGEHELLQIVGNLTERVTALEMLVK